MAIDRERFNAVGEEGYTAGKLLMVMQMFSPKPLIGPIATVHKLPKYMGVWCTEDSQNGPFFMWVNENTAPKFSGTIEDELGTATFDGTLGLDKMDFVKKYTHKQDDPISYHVIEKRDGIYLGTYRFGLETGTHDGCFVLEDYKPSDTLNAIVAKVVEKNKRR